MSAPWVAIHPSRFVDKRARLTRDSSGAHTRMVYQHVGAWRAVCVRRGENGKQEIERCPHAHSKMSAARKCGEQAAARWNREEAKAAKS